MLYYTNGTRKDLMQGVQARNAASEDELVDI
jgi:hypothetical protein